MQNIESRGNFIDGQWSVPASPDGEFLRENPADTNSVVFRIPHATADVDRAVKAAAKAQRDWDRRGVEGRLPYLERLRDALDGRREEMAQAISREMGKPLWEARGEAAALAKKVDIMCGEGLEFTAPVQPPGLTNGGWRHRPLGVVAVLGPFNFPLHLPNGHIIPALATGNTVVVKPSEYTPGSMQLYFECLEEAGFPDGVINLVQGPGAVGAALSAHRQVRGVLFTGGYATGQRIRKATIDQPNKLLALELGGKNTSIVCGDANLDQAAHAIIEAACMTTGQRCSATSRVVVEQAVADEFIDRLRGLMKRVTWGDPLGAEERLMGPLATESGFDGFCRAQADDEGGNLTNLVAGGADPAKEQGYFVRPALWLAREVDRQGTHQAEEIFGPDLVVYRVDGEEEASEVANATDYGLAMSVFSADEERFERFSYSLQTGILNLNRSTAGASSRLPFGGIKKSGNHRPAAILAGRYCTYPMASLKVAPEFDAADLAEGPLSRLRK